MKTLILMLLSIFLLTGTVLACQCVEKGDTHGAYAASKNVVVAKVLSVHRDGEGSAGEHGIRRTMMAVEKVYKGDVRPGAEMKFAQDSGAACRWAFSDESVGRSVLLFLPPDNLSNGFWSVGSCFGSMSMEGAKDTLYYLDNLATLGDKTRIYGTLYQIGESSHFSRMPGRLVRIRGNRRTIEVKTDKTGKFEIYGLKPGRYTITPDRPRGYKFTREQVDKYPVIELAPAAHAMADFYFSKPKKKK